MKSVKENIAVQQEPIDIPELVDVHTMIPDLVLEIRYAGRHNFIGEPVCGYEAAKCLLTPPAARALACVQDELRVCGLGLKIYDAYRPQRAVEHFLRWLEDPRDQRMKPEFYPRVEKSSLLSGGFLAARSSHSRASTVDLTLVAVGDSAGAAGVELEMGTAFDFFDVRSWTLHPSIQGEARRNRLRLKETMARHGFRNLPQEWWHFTLEDEPYPQTFFDVPVC